MNNENNAELENSLRTEIDNYLRTAVADLQSEIIAIQDKVGAEMERSRNTIEEVLKEATSRGGVTKIDDDFARLVAEHLQIAREDSANAINKLHEEETARNADGFILMRDAVNDISNQVSQAEILKTLIKHAASFASRGALFIIKSEHLVGWRIFGSDESNAEETVKEVFMSLSSDTLLGAAIGNAETQNASFGTHAEDSQFLNKLEFGEPKQMSAIPLIVRGRGVAVLYADAGANEGKLQAEALETLVRVASLTVELLASTRNTGSPKSANAKTFPSPQPKPAIKSEGTKEPTFAPQQIKTPVIEQFKPIENVEKVENVEQTEKVEQEPVESYQPEIVQPEIVTPQIVEGEPIKPESKFDAFSNFAANPPKDDVINEIHSSAPKKIAIDEFQFSPTAEVQEPESPEAEAINAELSTPVSTISENGFVSEKETYEHLDFSDPQLNRSIEELTNNKKAKDLSIFDDFAKPVSSSFDDNATPIAAKNEPTFEFESNSSLQQPFQSPQQFQPAQSLNLNDFDGFDDKFNANNFNAPVTIEQPQPEVQKTATPVITQAGGFSKRFGERNVDLPIDVPESDRRLHNDARRFARLLVSEIKLYNEQKVKEGRQTSDLYDRLREAIDRSREMYDKRVSPPVASKFDYFNFELVNTLAEGDVSKLGVDYPGAAV